jgi:hypothetical protein
MGDRGCFKLDQSETRSEKRREQLRLGIHAHAWCSQWSNDTLDLIAQHVKQALESFVGITETMRTWVWRQLAPGGYALLKERSEFIRKMMKKYGLS